MKQAVFYGRISTAYQVDGCSLENQESKVREWAKANGFEVIGAYCDVAISGRKSSNRPNLQKAMDLACKNKAALISLSLTRISRSVKDVVTLSERLKAADAELITLTENIRLGGGPQSALLLNIFSSLSQFESELISQRVSGAMGFLKAQGRRISGRVPYGFDCVGRALTENAQEQAVIEQALKMRKGGKSYGAIAKHLNETGVLSKNKGQWSSGALFRVLSNHMEKAVAA